MTGLVVFNGFDEARLAADLRRVRDEADASKAVCLLWMAGSYPEAASPELREALRGVAEAYGADLMRKAFNVHEDEARAWTAETLVADGLESISALTRYADLNLSDSLWTRLIQLAVVRAWIAECTGMRDVLIQGGDSGWLRALASTGALDRVRQVSASRTSWMAGWAVSWMAYLRNLLVDAYALLSRPPIAGDAMDVAIVGLEARNWKQLGDRRSLRFTYGLPDTLRQFDIPDPVYLLSRFRQNQRRLALSGSGHTSKDASASYLEGYATWSMWIRSYLSPDMVMTYFRHRNRTWRDVRWLGADVSHWVRDHARKAVFEEYPKNRMLQALSHRAGVVTPVRVALVPVHEMAEMRCIVAGLKQSGTTVLGIQQGALGAFHRLRFLPRFDVSEKAGLDMYPDGFLCEGDHAAAVLTDWLESQDQDRSVHITGAMRVTGLPALKRGGTGSAEILVLGEMHDQENALHWAAACAAEGFRTLYRPHPARRKEAASLINAMRGRVELDDAGTGLDESLAQADPRVVLCSNTGAAVEVALAGYPVFLMPCNDRPPFSPMEHPDSGVDRDAFGANGAVSTGYLEAMDVSSRSEADQTLARSHIRWFGKEARRRTAEVVASILGS